MTVVVPFKLYSLSTWFKTKNNIISTKMWEQLRKYNRSVSGDILFYLHRRPVLIIKLSFIYKMGPKNSTKSEFPISRGFLPIRINVNVG